MLARFLTMLIAAFAVPAAAQTPAASTSNSRSATTQSLEGLWTLKIDDVVIFAFRLTPVDRAWTGLWVRPASFASDGALFTRVEGPATAVQASSVQTVGEWMELTFNDPRPGAVPDVFRLRSLPGGKVEALYVGTGFAPITLERGTDDTKIGPWPIGKTYRRPGVTAAPGSAVVTFSSPPSTVTNTPSPERPATIGR